MKNVSISFRRESAFIFESSKKKRSQPDKSDHAPVKYSFCPLSQRENIDTDTHMEREGRWRETRIESIAQRRN